MIVGAVCVCLSVCRVVESSSSSYLQTSIDNISLLRGAAAAGRAAQWRTLALVLVSHRTKATSQPHKLELSEPLGRAQHDARDGLAALAAPTTGRADLHQDFRRQFSFS